MNELERALSLIIETVDGVAEQDGYAKLLRLLPKSKSQNDAAVCVLFTGSSFTDAKVLLTERASGLATHAGQVAFPGGSFEELDAKDPVLVAFRECEEEVGIARHFLKSIGVLPTLPTLTGNFVVYPVLATLDESRAQAVLAYSRDEVSACEWVSVQTLRESRVDETRAVSGVNIRAPYFMWGDKKMWGLSALIFDLILNRYDTIQT
jgi:8-oxo-dGTP pyrophosphatase MutT (NUDIX family)